MKQLILVSPKIDKHKGSIVPVVDADKSDSVIVAFFPGQLVFGDFSRGIHQRCSGQFSATGDSVKLHSPSNASRVRQSDGLVR